MNGDAETVAGALNLLATIETLTDGVRVRTHCLYPSGSFVHLVVRGGGGKFRLSDDGGALKEFLSTGVQVANPRKELLHAASAHRGLQLIAQEIVSPEVTTSALPAAIALVANASKEIAEKLYSTHRIERRRDFKRVVREFLTRQFVANRPVAGAVLGASQKLHKFDNVITLGSGRRLVVDAVVNDANSINSTLAANLDVAKRGDSSIVQRIVYDDAEEWSSPNLSLLSMGAITIPFSKGGIAFRPEALGQPGLGIR